MSAVAKYICPITLESMVDDAMVVRECNHHFSFVGIQSHVKSKGINWNELVNERLPSYANVLCPLCNRKITVISPDHQFRESIQDIEILEKANAVLKSQLGNNPQAQTVSISPSSSVSSSVLEKQEPQRAGRPPRAGGDDERPKNSKNQRREKRQKIDRTQISAVLPLPNTNATIEFVKRWGYKSWFVNFKGDFPYGNDRRPHVEIGKEKASNDLEWRGRVFNLNNLRATGKTVEYDVEGVINGESGKPAHLVVYFGSNPKKKLSEYSIVAALTSNPINFPLVKHMIHEAGININELRKVDVNDLHEGDFEDLSKNQMPLLVYACKTGNIELIRFLFENGIKHEEQHFDGQQAMYYAIASGKQDVVDCLNAFVR